MANSNIIGGISVLALAFTSPAIATGTDEQAQGERTQSERPEPNEQRHSSLSKLNQEQVERLQRQLQQRGHYEGSIDGIAGPKTSAAVRSFQVGRGLANSGQLDDETMTALGLDFEREPVRGTEMPEQQSAVGREPGAEGARANGTALMQQPGESENQHELSALSPEQTRELQVRLQERGYYRGEIDGIAGPQTRTALRQFFQRQSQLVAQGRVTESTLSAFGMDASEIEPVRGTEQPEPQRK
jgi:peptidoglycan hydrolase-like protein with peptidoglycan-binding domain